MRDKDRKEKIEVRSWKIEVRKQRKIIFFLFFVFHFLFFVGFVFGQEQDSDQQINDFSLSGFGEKGKKTWDVSGKSADILTDTVQLENVTGNMYGEKDNIQLAADKGDFNKKDAKVHLEDDVVITTSSGAKLTTDSLNWDRKNNLVATDDRVNIEKDNMITTATGALGQPQLNKVELKKDVRVQILPVKEKEAEDIGGMGNEKVVITCDGPLSIDYEKNLATFNNNVKVDRSDSQITSDKMEVYFNKDTSQGTANELINSKIAKIIARGNVKITRGENVSYSDEAVYNAADKKILLSGRPKLVLYSEDKP